MMRVLMQAVTASLGASTIGQLAKWLFVYSPLASGLLTLLAIAMGMSVWLLRYRERTVEAYFLLFWATVGLVLGIGV